MGKIYADIELVNTNDLALFHSDVIPADRVRQMQVTMLVDSGAYNLAINETIRNQLGLRTISKQIFELADGSQQEFEVVGPVEVRFKNRDTTTRAVVLPGNTEPLLGQIPMEDMAVVIFPREERLDVNPDTPFVPKKMLK
jgi:clan AA aspartic protease